MHPIRSPICSFPVKSGSIKEHLCSKRHFTQPITAFLVGAIRLESGHPILPLRPSCSSLTSSRCLASSGRDSAIRSSSVLAWVGGAGAGAEAEPADEAPPSCSLCCSFSCRRCLRRSLALRHGGRLGSAPAPEGGREIRRREENQEEARGRGKRLRDARALHPPMITPV